MKENEGLFLGKYLGKQTGDLDSQKSVELTIADGFHSRLSFTNLGHYIMVNSVVQLPESDEYYTQRIEAFRQLYQDINAAIKDWHGIDTKQPTQYAPDTKLRVQLVHEGLVTFELARNESELVKKLNGMIDIFGENKQPMFFQIEEGNYPRVEFTFPDNYRLTFPIPNDGKTLICPTLYTDEHGDYSSLEKSSNELISAAKSAIGKDLRQFGLETTKCSFFIYFKPTGTKRDIDELEDILSEKPSR